MPKSHNKRKNGKVAPKAQKPTRRQQFIDEQAAIYQSCLNLVAATSNGPAELIRNAAVVHGDKLNLDVLRTKSQALAADIRKLQSELMIIKSESDVEIGRINSKTDDLDVMTITVNVGNRYDSWMQRFTQITGPTVADITGLCQLEEIATNDA